MKKNELVRRFGPKLIDAIIQVMAEELNVDEQVLTDKIADRLDKNNDKYIKDYDWMDIEARSNSHGKIDNTPGASATS